MLSSLWTYIRHLVIGYALLVVVELAPIDDDGADLVQAIHDWAVRTEHRQQERRIFAAHRRRNEVARNPPP